MDIQNMMKQAKVMQDRMQEMQARLGDMTVEAQSGGGLVTVVATCKGEIVSVTISPEVIIPEDRETLEDLVKAAVNAARTKSEEKMAEETKKMMKEFGLPSDLNLPNM